MSLLRVLFIPTSSSGIMHWRIQGFVAEAHRSGAAQFVNPLWYKDLNDIQPWQKRMPGEREYDAGFVHSFVPAIDAACAIADAVVFQTVHTEGGIDLFDSIKLRYPNLPVLTETDDNILAVPTYNEAHGTYDVGSEVRARTVYQIKNSDAVIVSTPHLKEVYGEFNENIFVVPNSICQKDWDKVKRKSRGGIRIGWAGGNSREGDVKVVEQAIKNIVKRHKDVKFVFVAGPAKTGLPDWLKGVPQIEHHAKWVPVGKFAALLGDLDIDIGISPLVDSSFNRGKSNLKWLENSALGIPTVASNVGHYKETLRHGEDALLADDSESFEAALELLITDRKARRAMGLRAQERVRKDFNIEHTTRHYVECLRSVVSQKNRAEFPAELEAA